MEENFNTEAFKKVDMENKIRVFLEGLFDEDSEAFVQAMENIFGEQGLLEFVVNDPEVSFFVADLKGNNCGV